MALSYRLFWLFPTYLHLGIVIISLVLFQLSSDILFGNFSIDSDSAYEVTSGPEAPVGKECFAFSKLMEETNGRFSF